MIQCNNHDNWTSASVLSYFDGFVGDGIANSYVKKVQMMINDGGMSICVPMAHGKQQVISIAIVYMKLAWSALHRQEDHSSSVDEKKYIDDYLRNIHQLHG